MHLDTSKAWLKLQEMINLLITSLPNLVLAVIVFMLFLFLARGAKSLVTQAIGKYRRARGAGLILGRLAQWLILFAGLLLALSIITPSFQARDLIQLLGISGVAIGFAFRDILQNFLAGILLLLTEPFQIEDQIVVGNFEGTVEDIQTRATLIKTYDGRRVVIPNSRLFTESVIVNTAFSRRRTEYEVGIGYDNDIDAAKQIILQAILSVDGVLEQPPPDVLVAKLADSSVNLRARWWTRPQRSEVLAVQDRVIKAIKDRLLENGFDLPLPTQQIILQTEPAKSEG